MQMRLNRAEFLAELLPDAGHRRAPDHDSGALSSSAAAKDERLAIAATDLDVSLTSSVEAQVKREGAIAVQAKKFIEIIRSLASEEVSLNGRSAGPRR